MVKTLLPMFLELGFPFVILNVSKNQDIILKYFFPFLCSLVVTFLDSQHKFPLASYQQSATYSSGHEHAPMFLRAPHVNIPF